MRVQWLRGLRDDWEVCRPRSIFRERREPSRGDDVHLTPSQVHGVLPQQEYMDRTGTKVVLNLTGADNMKHVEPDDFIIHLRSFQGGIEHSTHRGKVSNAYTVFAPYGDVDPRYFRWVLKSDGFIQELRTTTEQLRDGQSIKFEQFADIGLPLPPLEAQRRIADFLDDQTARIDNIVEQRRQQAELLEQDHLAHIYDMFSGRRDQVSRRDLVGLSWLRSIPSAWPVLSVGQLYSVQLGQMLNDERARGTDLAPYLRNANVAWHDVRMDDLLEMSFAPEARRRYALRAGDLLVCEGGAGVAEAAVVPHHFEGVFYSKALHRVRRKANVPVEWLLSWLMLAKKTGVFEAEGQLTTIPHLPAEQLRRYQIPVPPDVEDRCAELERGWHTLQRLRARLNSSVDLLREMKESLITAAVVGELDVSTTSELGASA